MRDREQIIPPIAVEAYVQVRIHASFSTMNLTNGFKLFSFFLMSSLITNLEI